MGEERNYRINLIEAFLVSSMTKDKFMFPTIEQFILSEVANGVIKHIRGDNRNMPHINYQMFELKENEFEKNLVKELMFSIGLFSGIMDSKVEKAITELCAPIWAGESYHTELYEHFKGSAGMGICQTPMKSRFSLPYEVVVRAQRIIIPSFSDAERKDVEGIGKAMRPYIEQDLEFIKERYSW